MKTSRTRLQYLVLLAIPLFLVAVYGITLAKPKPHFTPKDPTAAGRASKPLTFEVGESEYGATSASQGESGSGFGGGFGPGGRRGFGTGAGLGYGGGSEENQRLIQGQNIMISWSKENDELRGFSQKSGEWTNLKIEPQTSLDPTVGTDVAAVRVGDMMAAYSGTTGTWGVLKLSEGSKAIAIVGTNVVQTTDNDYLYTFAASKGKWTSPNDPKFHPAKWSGYGNEYGSELGGVAPMSEYGSTRSGMISSDSKAKRFDQTALNLARQFRGKSLDDPEARAQLSQAVANAFDQRQAHQKIEAKRLQEKLKLIQDAIERRESLRERIIQRRVDELLDPNVEWESLSPSAAGSPIGLPGHPHLPGVGSYGTPAKP
ncbi:MAG TPA: hypothetical protein VMM56_05025 [Planctomycetaceae bacterium]|nr:hypothetical protein [Planctomycetaceae bacterium]